MKYMVVNEKYSEERTEVTIEEPRALLHNVFQDDDTQLEERADGIYEVESGELVAELID